MKPTALPIAALAAVVSAQRPADTSICDYYTTALFKSNTGMTQYSLVSAVVNTAIIGNYTQPNTLAVPGILAPGKFNGTDVNLLPYFTGGLASTNRGGSSGESVNFLDDGGATPLTMDKPANGTRSRQYRLITHLYQYFGLLLGCTQYGMEGFARYAGDTGMYEVHKYMGSDANEMGYFIQQVGLAAASFGVADADVQAVGTALSDLFGYRCSVPAAVVPNAKAELQAMCIADDCPIAPNATCSAYSSVVEPTSAVSTMTGTSSISGTSTRSTTSSTASPSQSGAAGYIAGEAGPLFAGMVAALAWML